MTLELPLHKLAESQVSAYRIAQVELHVYSVPSNVCSGLVAILDRFSFFRTFVVSIVAAARKAS
jgi:hypothetical protein